MNEAYVIIPDVLAETEFLEVTGARVHNLKNLRCFHSKEQAGGDHRVERKRKILPRI